ncbi:MAG: SpoIID/LytB domain-containing protein [Candidatus Nanopelagicales bacterium]
MGIRMSGAGRRSLVVATAALVVPATLALPVVDFSGFSAALGNQDPVTPTVASIALAEVDPDGLIDSPASGDVVPVIGDPNGTVHDHTDDHRGETDSADAETDSAIGPASEGLVPAAVTAQTSTDPFGLVGITAADAFDPQTRIVIRIKEEDGWSDWAQLPLSEHRPDPGTAEAESVRYATEPLATNGADGVQVRIDTPDGRVPTDTQLTMIDNPVTEQDGRLGTRSVPVDSAAAAAAKPTIITRAQWGADESLRRGTTTYADTVKVAFVHHVVSSNNYSEGQAAQQMRNVYSWFTQGIGVNDFGYNFVVDRFGNIYEGRAGGIDAAVNGAHTQGFNTQTFAVSFLGNADTLDPSRSAGDRIVNAFADLIAWKFAVHHVNPNATAVLTSSGPGPGQGGTSMYWPGVKVSSPTIAGHGDIGNTSCPGDFLRPSIPKIRQLVAQREGATFYTPSVSGSGMSWGSGSSIVVSPDATDASNFTMTLTSACGDVVRTVREDSTGSGRVALSWNGKDDRGRSVPPGRYTATVTGKSGGESFYPWSADVRISSGPGSPPDPCSPPTEFTVTGTGYGHGVGLSQWGALGQAQEGRSAEQILTHYFPGTQVQPVSEDVDLRIGLLHQVSFAQVRTEAISGSGGLELQLGNRVVPGIAGATYNFAPDGAYVQIKASVNGTQTTVGRAKNLTIRWSGTADPGTTGTSPTLLNVIGPGESFATPRHRYRYGTVEISSLGTSAGKRLSVVNVLDMSSYLKGIAEVPASWPAPALDAQTIASRSYALAKYNAGVRAACDCHMDDGGGPYFDQTFHAYAVESGPSGSRWVQSVQRTSSGTTGTVVTYQGQPIPAFYTAATGGRTQSSSDVWGGAGYPWARGVDDRWSTTVTGNPYKSWSVTASQARMGQIFGVSDIMTVQVSATLDSGAAGTVTAKTYDGRSSSVSGTSFRSALGLRSTYLIGVSSDQGSGSGGTSPSPTPGPSQPTGEPVSVTLLKRPTGKTIEGGTVLLKGRIKTMRDGLIVQRQVRWGSFSWQDRERRTADAAGRYTFTLADIGPVGTTYYWRTLIFDGSELVGTSPERKATISAQSSSSGGSNGGDSPSDSGTTRPRSDVSVSLVKRPGGEISAGATVTLRGRVAPLNSGAVVQRQVKWAGTSWLSRETIQPGANGRFRFTVPDVAPAGRTYSWRVVVLEGGEVVATSSSRSAAVIS